MKKSIPPNQGTKDPLGAYLPPEPPKATQDEPPKPGSDSIDGMLLTSLNAIYKALKLIHTNISSGVIDRADIQSLKDIVAMLSDLRDHEKELLEGMDAEQLKKAAHGD